MIGERLKKHIRHPIKGKIKSIHTRYFWLHPYTKTLYWSVHKPEQGECKLKSSEYLKIFKICYSYYIKSAYSILFHHTNNKPNTHNMHSINSASNEDTMYES